MSERSRPSIFWLLAGIAVPIMSVAAKIEIEDPENLPESGAFVLAPNHYSEIDPVIMGMAVWKLGRKPRFLAKAGLFGVPVVGTLLRASGQIPVQRGGSTRGSEPLKAARALVESGGLVIVYPEGSLTRDPDLWPMRGKTGAVRMALEQGIPIVPAAHWGTQKVMARYSKSIRFFPRSTVRVRIGEPLDLAEYRGRPVDSATLAAATSTVMDRITELLEGLRGETAPAERWNPADHDQKDTGRFDSK